MVFIYLNYIHNFGFEQIELVIHLCLVNYNARTVVIVADKHLNNYLLMFRISVKFYGLYRTNNINRCLFTQFNKQTIYSMIKFSEHFHRSLLMFM